MTLLNPEKEKFQMLSYQIRLRQIEKVFCYLKEKKLEPILIKGAAAAMYYPKPFLRTFSDIDLAFGPEQYKSAKEIIKEADFEVDLHKGLRHLDTLDWHDIFQNSRITRINTTSIRVLRLEDHLRVLCVHWLNDGGADRTRLWDIYFALSTTPKDFSWERFLYSVDEKRQYWLILPILLAEKYLGLEIDQFGFDRNRYKVPEWCEGELEYEWKNDERLTPLHQVLDNKTMLWTQIKKRFPPNYLQSLVETESRITSEKDIRILLRDFILRVKPSIKRILKMDGNKNI